MTDQMAQCISQIRIKTKNGFTDVPCGRCNFCLQNRRKEWSFRLQKELRHHTSAFFITLTYDEINVPIFQSDEGKLYCVLEKRDFQLFMKRLRKMQSKAYPNTPIKYYAVGEYGSKTARPHYHAILFGIEPKIVVKLHEIWQLGMVHTGTVTNDSIDYVTKYVVNKYDFKNYPVPPFALISNGIGLQHLNANFTRYKNEGTVLNNRGYKQVVPRYYRDKLETNPFTKAVRKKQSDLEHQRREAEELERLAKLHPDPIAYMQERAVANHDRIQKQSKKGDKL